MTGGGPHTVRPVTPDPSPTPVLTEETTAAKGKVKKKKKGRDANILAGRMMQGRQILKRRLGDYQQRLGE
ncbi:MAG: hypothetical protein HQ580_15195 [Planctomycetes bacterium]|nr:hypothetical protein [Planctomycetota bacterium]